MKMEIGVMQGRLLPKYKGRYQAHPVGLWKSEFLLAKNLGLDLIEFILDFDRANENPLLLDSGRSEILEQMYLTDVRVKTICADYFMDAPLHHADASVSKSSIKVLEKLLLGAAEIGVTDVIIPCVDHASLVDECMKSNFVDAVTPIFNMLNELNINLALETDLNPEEFIKFLERFDCSRITVNYDTGNSASLGYDPSEELRAYGGKISDVHIKDRFFGGGSVVLGAGDADFEKFFDGLKGANYQGPFILQAYRDDEGVQVFREQLAWFRERIKVWYEG